MTAAEPTGFIGWTMQYGQVLGFYVQIAYWIVLSISAFWAAKVFARYVKYMTTEEVEIDESEEVEEIDVSESAVSDEQDSARSDKKKSVDEFVE